MNVTGSLARSILNENDPNPGVPTKGESFLCMIVSKNLSDLCETGQCIIDEMKDMRISLEGLPSTATLNLIRNVISEFYDPKMFIEDPKLGQRPNWKAIQSFDKDNSKASFQLYRIIRKNVKESKDMGQALKDRNKIFFLKNIDIIFADLPFQNLVGQFKNFIGSKNVPEESQDLVWSFFEELIGLILKESEHIKTIESL